MKSAEIDQNSTSVTLFLFCFFLRELTFAVVSFVLQDRPFSIFQLVCISDEYPPLLGINFSSPSMERNEPITFGGVISAANFAFSALHKVRSVVVVQVQFGYLKIHSHPYKAFWPGYFESLVQLLLRAG